MDKKKVIQDLIDEKSERITLSTSKGSVFLFLQHFMRSIQLNISTTPPPRIFRRVKQYEENEKSVLVCRVVVLSGT